ncbi:MAG TPA: hypothetical protein VNZ53_04370, partial [Steroidobacteraceae bacterium]|nr:hypothetical protein [Steroidobacteraceae bacterium]
AVKAFREALKERTREHMPLQWATMQNNLGNVLQALGKREKALGKRESGTERLLEAVEAYRDALKEWTRERVPLQWATMQRSLGFALCLLDDGNETGTARLEEAVAAFDACLTVTTSVRPPDEVNGLGALQDGVRALIGRRKAH